MRNRIWRQSAAFVVAAGIPWGFVGGQGPLQRFDPPALERVLEILPQLRDEDWCRRRADPSRRYVATMLNEEAAVGEPVYVLVLGRGEVREQPWESIYCEMDNLRLVDGSGALVPVTLKWRYYTKVFSGFDIESAFQPRIIKRVENNEHHEPSLRGLQVWAFELGRLFDLSRAGSYRLQFVPTHRFPDLPFRPDLKLSFRVIDPEE